MQKLRLALTIKNVLKALIVILLLFLIGILILQWLFSPVGELDESTILVGSMLVKQGLIPNKDFWSYSTPLNYYFNAMVFSILGLSVISTRILSLLLYFLTIVTLVIYFRTFAKTADSFKAIIFIILSFLIMLFPLTIQSKWNAYAFAFLGLLLYLLSLRMAKRYTTLLLVLSGLMTSLACLSKINFGGYIVLAVLFDLGLQILKLRYWDTLKKGIFFCSSIIICLAFYLIFCSNYITELIDQVIVFPTMHLERNRIIALAFLKDANANLLLILAFILIWLVIVFPLIWLTFRTRSKNRFGILPLLPLLCTVVIIPLLFLVEFEYVYLLPKVFILILCLILIFQVFSPTIKREEFVIIISYSLFLHYFLSRTDPLHYAPLVPLIVILFPYFSYRITRNRRFNNNFTNCFRYLSTPLICFSFAFPLLVSWLLATEPNTLKKNLAATSKILRLKESLSQGDSNFLMSAALPLSLPESNLYPDRDELEALQFVYRRTRPRDFVYIGLKDHSKTFLFNIRSYWILNRKIGVKNYDLEPGLTTEDSIQRRISTDLQKNHVKWIILGSDTKVSPILDKLLFGAANYNGAKFLNFYIKNNYKLVREFGCYSIYTRKIEGH